MERKNLSRALGIAMAACVLLVGAGQAWATTNVFSLPAGQTSLVMVPVADVGNAPDTSADPQGYPTNLGGVNYAYNIGKYDVTAAQYTAFLNAVAITGDPYGLYDWESGATGRGNTGCGIIQTVTNGGFSYSTVPGRENFPVNYVSWGDAVRFCNWLSNGQPTGVEGPGTTETGSYTLNGAMDSASLMAVTRNPGARYVLPTYDEWFKAAFYKAGSTNAGYWLYPTRTNNMPTNALSSTGTDNANYYDLLGLFNSSYTDGDNFLTDVGTFAGSPGPYGTYDQGGDVWQWTENGQYASWRNALGGSWADSVTDMWAMDNAANDQSPVNSSATIGFRIAEVPEPTSLGLLGLGVTVILARRRRS